MTARGEGDTDGVGERGGVDVLGLIELEAYLREVIELGDGWAGDLGGDAAFEDGVEEGVDWRGRVRREIVDRV